MESVTPQKRTYSPGIRVIAAVLAVVLLFSIAANGFTRVRIEPGEKTEAATNYLVDNTGYVNEGQLGRLEDKVQTLEAPVTLEDYYQLAGVQIAEENYAGALESISECIRLDTGVDPALTQDLLMKQGCLLVLLEDYDQALTVLNQVTQQDSAYADAYLVKAQIYAQQQEHGLLAEAMEMYLLLCPEDTELRLVLAQTYFTLEQFEDARQQYGILLEKPETLEDPGEVYFLRALTDIQLGDFASAETHLESVKALAPETDGLYYYLGVCQMSREDYPAAAETLTVSIERSSMVQLSLYSRGVCGLVIEGYDLNLVVSDLQQAAQYAQPDADPNISKQAEDLLTQLTTPQGETLP